MADRQLKLYAQTTAGGTKQTTTTISNVNPQATSATMKSFGQQLNALTTNTYQKTDLVETTNVDTETIKIMPTIIIGDTYTRDASTGNVTIPATIENAAGVSFGIAMRTQSPYNFVKADMGIPVTHIILYNVQEAGSYRVSIGVTESTTTYSCAVQKEIDIQF